jgi:hypothetical protein
MTKIQRVEDLNRSTRVTNALLPSIHVVGADIANCEHESQTTRDDRARFALRMLNWTKLERHRRGSAKY